MPGNQLPGILPFYRAFFMYFFLFPGQLQARKESIRRYNCCTSMGLAICAFIPACMATVISSANASAVMAMTGIPDASLLESRRISLVAHRPSITGIRISIRTKS